MHLQSALVFKNMLIKSYFIGESCEMKGIPYLYSMSPLLQGFCLRSIQRSNFIFFESSFGVCDIKICIKFVMTF